MTDIKQKALALVNEVKSNGLMGDALRADMARFIIAKPDPLVEALLETFPRANGAEGMASDLRAAIEARGGKIVWGDCSQIPWRNEMIDEANHKLDSILLPVNNELGDSIVKAWLKLHLAWAQDAYDNSIHAEDKADAEVDIAAFRRVLEYIGVRHD